MQSLKIRQIQDFPFSEYDALKQESLGEGYNFLERLEDEWAQDINRFSKPGEGLYGIFLAGEFVLDFVSKIQTYS